MNLTQIANKWGSDKGNKHFEAHNYTPMYERYLESLRDKDITFLEIGINDPRFPKASPKMWDEYFTNPKFKYVGYDITDCSDLITSRINIIQGDQGKATDLEKAIVEGPYDVILDDGSHFAQHQIISFIALFPSLKSGGLYFIEDLHAHDGYATIEFFKVIAGNPFGIKSLVVHNNKLMIITKE